MSSTVRIVTNSPHRQSAYQNKPLPSLPPECPAPLSVRHRPASMRPPSNNRTTNNAMSPTPRTKVQKNSTGAPKTVTHASASMSSMSSLTHAHPLRSNPVFEQQGQRHQLQPHQPEMSRTAGRPHTTQNFEEMERKIAAITGTPMANASQKPAGPRPNHAGGARNQHHSQGYNNKRDSTFSRFRNRVKQGVSHHHLHSSSRNLSASSSTSSLESTLSDRSLDEDEDMDRRLSRRIAEGDNLRKRKVQALVGDGKVRRKPVPQGSSVRNSMVVVEGLPAIV